MKSNWPDKKSREDFEISAFIKAYKRLPHGKNFSIESRREGPDFILTDKISGIKVGVELTSVYMNDRSVPDKHISNIPEDKEELEAYKKRIVAAIKNKIKKARKNYVKDIPLILSIYINEYISIYLTSSDLEVFVEDNHDIFNDITPFSEIVLWNLMDSGVFSIRS